MKRTTSGMCKALKDHVILTMIENPPEATIIMKIPDLALSPSQKQALMYGMGKYTNPKDDASGHIQCNNIGTDR
jgi:hypothetical protein